MNTKYVVGFAFSEKGEVLLIKKKRPEWQKGRFNGIGGKIEIGESPLEAMERECYEETGLSLKWSERGMMDGFNDDGSKFVCYIFYAVGDIYNFVQKEDEKLYIIGASFIYNLPRINNLDYLIPYGLSGDRAYLNLIY